MAKEQAILELVVDQSDLLKDAASSKKAILDLKDAQSELNKEFKKGTIDVEEYATESVKLEQKLKKEQATYSNLTKAINTQSGSLDAQRLKLAQLTRERNALDQTTQTGIKNADRLTQEIKQLNAEISKQEQKGGDFRRNVGNYGTALKDAAANANIAGVNIGSLSTQIASFANPATAAVGILTALGSVYASSAAGARDLASAQKQLSTAASLATNEFGRQIDILLGGEGTGEEGFLSKLAFGFNVRVFGAAEAGIAKVADNARKALQELEITELTAKAQAKNALENAEELRRLRDDDAQSLEIRIKAAQDVQEFIDERERILLQTQKDRLGQLLILQGIEKSNLDLRKQVKTTEFEIADISEDSEGKRTEARNELIRLERELLTLRKLNATVTTNVTLSDREKSNFTKTERTVGAIGTPDSTDAEEQRTQDLIRGNAKFEIEATQSLERAKTELEKQESEKRIQQAGEEFKAKSDAKKQEIESLHAFINAASGIFNEQTVAYKVLASADAVINTYKGANLALGTYPPPFSFAIAAATIASGLANVAKINGIEFAEGGWTGPGKKYDPVGIVHADEYVTPKHIVNSPMAKPHLAALERMRTGYADGGFVTGQNISAAQQNLQLMNAMRNAPAPVVSVVEITRKQERVEVRETVSKLGSR